MYRYDLFCDNSSQLEQIHWKCYFFYSDYPIYLVFVENTNYCIFFRFLLPHLVYHNQWSIRKNFWIFFFLIQVCMVKFQEICGRKLKMNKSECFRSIVFEDQLLFISNENVVKQICKWLNNSFSSIFSPVWDWSVLSNLSNKYESVNSY